MAELLLELLYEEIPALMQKPAEEAYKEIFIKILGTNQIEFNQVQTFISPRRIAIYIDGLNEVILSKNTEFKGPSVNASSNAIEGFCKTHNINSAQLEEKVIKGERFYVYNHLTSEQKMENLLIEIIFSAIKEYVWPKSMYWGDYHISSIRPLKNILCIFNSKILDFQFFHLTSNNITQGHRFLGKSDLQVKDFTGYVEVLKENYVVLDRNERKGIITSQMQELAAQYNLTIKQDDRLLEEVAGLVEYPVTMIGKINEEFLKLPQEVLITSMRTHQKYFSLFRANGDFAPYFLFVSNILSSRPEIIVRGNEKVITARLSDALYFYEQDLRKTLEGFLPDLKLMNFHSKLGNIEDKAHRIGKICHYLDPENIELQLAARLCKADLVSQMIKEFPELQGIMGYYYAAAENLPDPVALAIRGHYKPQGPNSSVPTGDSGLLAIADKIDSLVGLMLAGEIPTGSKDPYALRRMCLGIIRIILENKVKINLKELVSFTSVLYQIDSKVKQEVIISFIEERIKNYLKGEYDFQLLNALIDLKAQGDLVSVLGRLDILKDFLSSPRSEQILATYKRVSNIIGSYVVGKRVREELFNSNYEINLFKQLQEIDNKIEGALEYNKFEQTLSSLESLVPPINDFFDNLMVKDENQIIANNRLALIYQVKALFHKIAKFDLL